MYSSRRFRLLPASAVNVFCRWTVVQTMPSPVWRGLSVVLAVALLLCPLSVLAVPGAADTSASPQKYWIFLDERPGSKSLSPEERWTQPVAPTYQRRLREEGVRPIVQSRWLHAVSARLSSPQRTQIERLPFVQSTQPVASGKALSASAAPAIRPLGLPWGDTGNEGVNPGRSRDHLARINALQPLARGLDGHGVRVGFLDAHFRGLRHPAFSSLRREGRLLGLRNFTNGLQSGNHGLAVTSLAVGREDGSLVGPAYGAEVLGATTEYTHYERNVEEDFFVAGLEWLQRNGVDVVNVSIGYTRFDDGERSYEPEDLDGDTAVTTRAVDRAAQLGVTVVTSAGNSGCQTPDGCWYYVNTPADADSVITVGAVAPDSSLAPFSSRGPTADGRIKPDVVVQGQELVAAWQDDAYAQVGGTSFASPQVTGIAALLLQVNPDLSPMDLRRLLRQTASQANRPDSLRGWGVVNAEAALRTAEWQARAAPPPSLEAEAAHPMPASSHATVPVRAPSGASTLEVTVFDVYGRPVHSTRRAIHPGPNWITLSVKSLPPGRYRYRLRTDSGDQTTGRLSVVEETPLAE